MPRFRIHTAFGLPLTRSLSQTKAKLVYRTVLAVDDPEDARHVVPLKLRKAVKPVFRKVGHV